MRQNEFLFNKVAVCTRFGGHFLLNLVRFGAKRGAFCTKTQSKMPLNVVRFGAKRKVKWC